jgi:hypothetical protein
MKKLSVIWVVPVILALTMVLVINTPAQDTNSKIYIGNPDKYWPSTSEMIIAYHDLPQKPDPWEDLNIHGIADFIDKSVKDGTLQGYESGSGSLADERLNILKDKIVTAANAFENSTFQETCKHLLGAYLSTDGLVQPPDLVYGQAAPELAKMIEYVRVEIIGCE